MKLIDWLALNPTEHLAQVRYHHGELKVTLLNDGIIRHRGIGDDLEEAADRAVRARVRLKGET